MGYPKSLMVWLGFLVILQPACADDIQGRLRLLVVPLHDGRNPNQDPFSLVDSVELGITADNGAYKSLGDWSPSAKFGPGLVGEQGTGSPTLTGLNEKGRSISRGFGSVLGVVKGVDEYVNIPFARIDYAVANWLRPVDRALPDPYGQIGPSLLMDDANLEQGQRDGEQDSGCLVWFLWDASDLWVRALVTDDSLKPSGVGPLADGDALVFYLDMDADGEPGDADDLKVAIAPDGRVEPEGMVDGLDVTNVAGGYMVQFRIPLTLVRKNQWLGLDLRQLDLDEGDSAPSILTWVFDPRKQGLEPEPADYGKLVLSVPIMSALGEPGPSTSFSGQDGMIETTSWWDDNSVHFLVHVADDDVKVAGGGNTMDGADVVEFILDLDNAGVPIEDTRFFKLAVSAGGSQAHQAGPNLGNMTELGVAFSGRVDATVGADGYSVEVEIPWQDLKLKRAPEQAWFLGLEIIVKDRDEAEEHIYSWSGAEDTPDVWGELRLFGIQ